MNRPLAAFGLMLLVGSTAIAADRSNPLFESLCKDGFEVGGTRVTLPLPKLADGASADDERATLRAIAGSERATADFLRDSISAPSIMKVHDQAIEGQGTVRIGDLWFVVRADLDAIDPKKLAGASNEEQTVEAANMRFTVKPLDEAEKADGKTEWRVHIIGRLLDRIHFEATDRIVATRSDRSWLVASRSEGKKEENRWNPIKREGEREVAGESEDYPGGISTLKVSRLETVPGALLIEAHFAFFEPRAWFDGAPILRSKLNLIAQDRVRELRRELAKARAK